MDRLIWKQECSNGVYSQKLTWSVFVELIQKIISENPEKNEFDFRLIYTKPDLPEEKKENYFGFSRYGWNNCQENIMSDFSGYFKKNIVELYLRDAK